MSHRGYDKYIDLKFNGRLFPTWMLANFRKYKIPEIIRKDDEDPCSRGTKLELRQYQIFLTKYLDYRSPYRDILVYHGLGSGKSSSAINIYNMLYNYTPGWNVFVLLKATLRDSTWMKELKIFLDKDEFEYRFKNIVFISYDAPNADKQFMDAIKNADTSKRSLYIVDEAHNFIRNVYSNINSKHGKRAQTIYDYIIQDKRENEGVRVVLLSGTPAINTPYELALLFNLLRPGTFPKSEVQFNQFYVSPTGMRSINPAHKNMFQRRIMGLVSYYYGATPDLYASKRIYYVDVKMSQYQEDTYKYFEQLEDKIAKKKRGKQGGSETYKTYTRQSSNFVFPALGQIPELGITVQGDSRPRPSSFKISEKEAEKLIEGKESLKLEKGSDKLMNVQKYLKTMEYFIKAVDNLFARKSNEDESNKHSIMNDFDTYLKKYNANYDEFLEKETKKSGLFNTMFDCSSKMICVIFNILRSPGPVLVYSNYVSMEGLEIFKIYLKHFGFSPYQDLGKGKDNFRHMEYHGGIDAKERALNLDIFNNIENKHGKTVKIIMISPAGAEGVSLANVRQVHIMEPYWHEVRITQMIGRAIRQCSHKNLPMSDRHVDIFRYKSVKKNSVDRITTDQYIEDAARRKDALIQSFLDTVKEVAVDCGLNKGVNMMAEEYKCFQFDEESLFDDEIGRAYAEDINDDMKLDNGSNSLKSQTVKVKVKKIQAVKQLSAPGETETAKYSKAESYFYNPETLVVYDYELMYPIGKIGVDDENLPKKLDNETYIIDRMVPIPHIDEK